MRELTIVSPHRDDVPFSLYLCLSQWRHLPLDLNVVTVFTVSVYAPRLPAPPSDLASRRAQVTSVRKREDRRVFNLIEKRIKVDSFDLLDAPLRLGISLDAICTPEARSLVRPAELEALSRQFRSYFLRGLVLAPLALGDHVDHLAVRTAVIQSSARNKLGFYEDLPYATRVSDDAVVESVSSAEHSTGVPLKGCIVRNHRYTWRKRGVIARYASQISPAESTAMARFTAKRRGGERIWIPKRSRAWNSLVQHSHV